VLCSVTRAIDDTVSSPRRFISRTPCVGRPMREMPSAAVRMTVPSREISMTSKPSRTIIAPASRPRASV
jgi:hypothetical protein